MNMKLGISSIMSLLFLLIAGAMASCNRDEVIISDGQPEIIFDNPSGIYTICVDSLLTIAPQFKNMGEGTPVRWMEEEEILSTERILTVSWPEAGTHYITVSASEGSTIVSEDIRVEVVNSNIPLISLPFEGDSVMVLKGETLLIEPDFSNNDTEDFVVSWAVDGEKVSSDVSYSMYFMEPGIHSVEIIASNSYGSSSKELTLSVVESLPEKLYFLPVSYYYTSTDRFTFAGRPVYLSPEFEGLAGDKWEWFVNGSKVRDNGPSFKFTPDSPGSYQVRVVVDSRAEASVTVICVDGSEESGFRSGAGSELQTKVHEYVPAPGQFIGDTKTGGMSGKENTRQNAEDWAYGRLKSNLFVSLGSFGGYIVVGFDHSIEAGSNEYDFVVLGNAFLNMGTGSNEPGIVYVMQDVNGNGLPDDEWYELRGSEYGKSETIANYAVTYYRPAGPCMNVLWKDNLGGTGKVEYLRAYHSQPSYFPAWIEGNSYTLRGTRLKSKVYFDEKSGNWNSPAYDWGYADNMGSDSVKGENDGEGQQCRFKISNAVFPDGTPVNLKYVDFIKVQSGVSAQAGWTGEISTEVCGIKEYKK